MDFTIQKNIFDRIQSLLGNERWLYQVADVLNMSYATLYKRYRGQKELTLTETMLLIQHYDLPLTILDVNNLVTPFNYSPLAGNIISPKQYIHKLLSDLLSITSLKGLELHFLLNDPPLFYTFSSPSLTMFSFYMYENMVWNRNKRVPKPFNLSMVSEYDTIVQMSKVFLESYYTIPETQYWAGSVLDNLLNQMRYVWKMRLFESLKDIHTICNSIKEMLQHIELMAKHGKKFAPGKQPSSNDAPLMIYHNEMSQSSNTVYIRAEDSAFQMLYITLDNPNFIRSTDTSICEYTYDWLLNVQRYSQALHLDNEVQRSTYFKKLYHKIDVFLTEIEVWELKDI